MTTLLPCAVAWVIGGFHMLSILPGSSRRMHQPGPRPRPVRLSLALCRSFDRPLQRIGGSRAVPVLVVGGDEVGVAVDPVLVDVETVEFLVGLDPDADGGLENREYRQRRDEDEASGRHYPQGLHPELVEAAAVEEAGLADGCKFRGSEEPGGERAPDAAHAVGRDGPERVVDPDPV